MGIAVSKSRVALSVAWNDVGTGSWLNARRWVHLAALLLLVLGCLAKGVIVAKAAYLQGRASERAIALLLSAGEGISESGDEHGKGSPATCVSASHIAPLSWYESVPANLRETAVTHILPHYPVPPGWSGQPLDRPPRLPA